MDFHLVWRNIWLTPDPNCNMMFDNMRCTHTILFVRQLQCSQLRRWLCIFVQGTTFLPMMLHSPYLSYTKISAPYKWIRHPYISSGNSNNLLWYFRHIYHHFPWNGKHSTTYHLGVRQLLAFYGLYLWGIVLRLRGRKKWKTRAVKNWGIRNKDAKIGWLNFPLTWAKLIHRKYDYDDVKHDFPCTLSEFVYGNY